MPLYVSSILFSWLSVEFWCEDGDIKVTVVENKLEIEVSHAYANEYVDDSNGIGESV